MASRLVRFPWPMNVGTDICQVSRIQTILSCPTGRGRHFIRRVLCQEELRRPSSKLKPYLRAVVKFAQEHDTLKKQGKEIEGFGHGHKRLEHKWKSQGVDLGEVAGFMAGRFAAKEAAIKAHPHRHLTFHDIIIAKAAELDQIERELLGLPSSESHKTFSGSTTGPTTPVDPKDITPEDLVFEQKLQTDKPDGNGDGNDHHSRSFTGSTTGPATKVDPKDIMPEDRLFEQQLETIDILRHDVFEGSTTGPNTPVDANDVMPEDSVFDYQLETDKSEGYDRPKGSKSCSGSTKGPKTKVDKGDVMPEGQFFDQKLQTDKPNGNGHKTFTGSTTGSKTPVNPKDITPEDLVFDQHLQTDKPNGSSPPHRTFTGSTTGPTTPVDPHDIMPEDRVFDYRLETDKPDTPSDTTTTTVSRRRTTVPQEAPGRARLGSGPPVAIIRGVSRGEGGEGGEGNEDHQVALISISHDGDYATATCVGFDRWMMVKGGLGWMVTS